MSVHLFDELVDAYDVNDDASYRNAVREVTQQIALAGLNRSGFFDIAAFYGGTCLKIYYGLDRYSEDLDFSLLAPSDTFSLSSFSGALIEEFEIVGREVTITEKQKTATTAINSAFLKDNTRVFDLQGQRLNGVKIKIEVDTDPPPNFDTEYKLSMQPYSFMTRCYTLSSSFAGKMSALLYRAWRNRIKGRDWYDFEWYVRNGVAMDLAHYNTRVCQFGNADTFVTADEFRNLLREKIQTADIEKIKDDVIPFINDASKLNIWSRDYFLQVADMMNILEPSI
jgi:predicted nucleotidyltransferase component of viral defense system